MSDTKEYPVHKRFPTMQDIENYFSSLVKMDFNSAMKYGDGLHFDDMVSKMTSIITEFIYEEVMMAFDAKELE